MVVKKVKGKEWFVIVAPSYFGGVELGRTLAAEPKELIGRRLTANVASLSGDMSKFYMKITFRINGIENNRALTEFEMFECLRDYLARMVVYWVRRIDSVQDLITKDGIKLRVKTLATTSKKARTTTEKAMRMKIGNMVKAAVEGYTLEELLKKIISDELRSTIIAEGRKIYPLKNFEFRRVERLS